MKNVSFISLFAAALGVVVLCGCSDSPTGSRPGPNVRELTSIEKQTLDRANQFSFGLFNNVCRSGRGRNVFISPLSASFALGMVLNGANGTTRSEMESVLGWSGMTTDDINNSYSSLSDYLVKLDPNVTIKIANSIWYRNGFPVESSFIDVNRNSFNAEVGALDFSSPDAVKTINGWVAGATNQKIQTVLNQIPDGAMMFLINAVYFNGTWKYTFDESSTKDEMFTSQNGAGSIVKMMSMTASIPYYSDSAYQAADLPYGDSLYSMTIILPTWPDQIDELAESLDQHRYSSILSSLYPRKGTLSLPRLEVNYDSTMNGVLQTMGMKAAFDPNLADLSGICKSISIYIEFVKQVSYLRVDEKGTEAAAVTVVGIYTTGVRDKEDTFVMKVDHPFLMVIHERSSGAILFMGKIITL